MSRHTAMIYLIVLSIGYYFGGGCEGPEDLEPEPRVLRQYDIVEVEKPYLPEECELVLVDATDTLLWHSSPQRLGEFNTMLDNCFNLVDSDQRNAERRQVIYEATERVNTDVPVSDVLTEGEVEEAFEECEIEYGDTDYCDDHLEDFLSRD